MPIQVITREFAPSGSSEDYDESSGISSIDFFYGSKDKFRVAPDYELVEDWPFETEESKPESKELVDSMQVLYEAILRKYNIQHTAATVENVHCRGYINRTDTLVMITEDEDPRLWKIAATEIRKLIDDTLLAEEGVESTLEITVEIRNPKKMYQAWSTAIRPDTPACEAGEILQTISRQILKLIPQWRLLSITNRGPPRHEWERDNEREPTIMITVQHNTRENWALIEHQIRDAVGNIDTDIDFDFHLEIFGGVGIVPAVARGPC